MKQYPISQIFGPTRQGEGKEVGMLCVFVRFAGCDEAGDPCAWCDTLYAVTPRHPGWQKVMATPDEVVTELNNLSGSVKDVVLSGGNPALFTDELFATTLMKAGYRLHMETQGSTFPYQQPFTWESFVNLTVSPKPPSAGAPNRGFSVSQTKYSFELMHQHEGDCVLKYVAFDREDLNWIAHIDQEFYDMPWVDRYISAGTTQGASDITEHRAAIASQYRKLHEYIGARPDLYHMKLGLQVHSMVWGPRTDV